MTQQDYQNAVTAGCTHAVVLRDKDQRVWRVYPYYSLGREKPETLVKPVRLINSLLYLIRRDARAYYRLEPLGTEEDYLKRFSTVSPECFVPFLSQTSMEHILLQFLSNAVECYLDEVYDKRTNSSTLNTDEQLFGVSVQPEKKDTKK